MSAAAAVVRLDAARARRLTDELRRTLDVAVELVRELWQGEAWRALGHGSWEAFCAAELPQLAVIVRGMPREQRDAKVAELRAGGVSLRGVSAVTGVAPNTVRAAAKAAGVQLETVLGRDGVERPAAAAPRTPAPRVPTTERVLRLVASAGPDGITVREVCKGARLHHGQASGTLTNLAKSGRLLYRAPAKRGQHGRWVAP